MLNFKVIKDAAQLLSVTLIGTTAVTKHTISGLTRFSHAFDALAEDAEDAAVKNTEINKLDRSHRYKLRLAEVKQLESGIINPEEFQEAKSA